MTEAPGSQVFSCNLDAVDATITRLQRVLRELDDFTKRNDGLGNPLASDKISDALRGFSDGSSDQREKVKGSVEALTAMLKGLADGVRQVDSALAGSLPDVVKEQSLRPVSPSPSAADQGRASQRVPAGPRP